LNKSGNGDDVNDEIMTIKEIAVYLKVTDKTIYRLLTSNKLPAFKVGGSWRFQKDKIDQWISSQQDNKLV
jgi:excisionase family DNA binding protein